MPARLPLLLAALLLVACACEPFADAQDFDREQVPIFRAKVLTPPSGPGSPPRLRVMAWNVKYGAKRIPFWFDCWGDRVQMSKAEVDANLKDLYAFIDEVDPDVLMTEEIEVNSRRSAYVDMVQGILDHTKLNYAAYVETWDSRYIASEGLGRMNLGNAIFSKYPIEKAERIRQVDRTDQSGLTSTFYIKRAVGRVELDIGTANRVAAYVVHTEAYDNDGTKGKQIQQIHELVTAETLPWVVGGDFNELPPNAVRKEGFADERSTALCSDDFAQPPYTPEIMTKFYQDFVPWIPLDRLGTTESEQKRYFTHSVLGPDEQNEKGEPGFWNRTLDYLFARQGSAWQPGSTDVLQQAGQKIGGDTGIGPVLQGDPLRLSDHAPVFGVWEVN